ncbi:MAG: hypothetical protein EBZ55_02575 [Actinobacteria bacterium]|nr:hypothetical protein [Actinomycetota bacterium]
MMTKSARPMRSAGDAAEDVCARRGDRHDERQSLVQRGRRGVGDHPRCFGRQGSLVHARVDVDPHDVAFTLGEETDFAGGGTLDLVLELDTDRGGVRRHDHRLDAVDYLVSGLMFVVMPG